MLRMRSLAVLLATILALLAAGAAAAQPASSGRTVLVGDIAGVVNPTVAGYVGRVIDQAESSQAAAVVFKFDTPGGLSDSTRDITQRTGGGRPVGLPTACAALARPG